MTKEFEIFWDDLTTYTQQKLKEFGLEVNDFPIATITIEEDEDRKVIKVN